MGKICCRTLDHLYRWSNHGKDPGRVESFKSVERGMKSWVVESSSVQVGKCQTRKAKSGEHERLYARVDCKTKNLQVDMKVT